MNPDTEHPTMRNPAHISISNVTALETDQWLHLWQHYRQRTAARSSAQPHPGQKPDK